MQLGSKLESHFANENRHYRTHPILPKVTQHLAHFAIAAEIAFFSFAAKTIAMRLMQLISIIEIEQSVNDPNVIVSNEDEQFVVPLRTRAMRIVTEAVNSTAANASDAKKASAPLVIRKRMRFRIR